ncbi:MAG: hypothetical protein AUG91_01330 [Actinobacteria bacterium 13_1_20CM_4_69_9]|nr:MAG: hypothetical protein AUG91_01330 [Actinobacteria bacterium 13_1_20CM_4_69_9]
MRASRNPFASISGLRSTFGPSSSFDNSRVSVFGTIIRCSTSFSAIRSSHHRIELIGASEKLWMLTARSTWRPASSPAISSSGTTRARVAPRKSR